MTLNWSSKKHGPPVAVIATGALAIAAVMTWPQARLGMAVATEPHADSGNHESEHAKSSGSHGHGSASADHGSAALAPEKALERLREGNERFVAGRSNHPNINRDRRLETARGGQFPIATIIGCSDSRAPIEAIFDQGVGDLFIIRVAGNVCGTDEIGSIEYGVDHLNTPVLVVLGHTGCGAVTAAATDAELHGNLPGLIAHIQPAVEQTKADYPRLLGKELVPMAITANVWNSVEVLLRKSDAVRQRVTDGRVQVIGALYDLESGNIRWLGEHPEQEQLLTAASATEGHAEAAKNGHSARVQPADGHEPEPLPDAESEDEDHGHTSHDDHAEEGAGGDHEHASDHQEHDDDHDGGH